MILAGGGCRVFDEALLDGTPDAGPRDGGSGDAGNGIDGGMDAGPGCELARPPARPEGTDDGEDVGELFYVLHHFTLDQAEDDSWRTIGFDLDGICSMAPEPRVECIPPASGSPAEIDGEGGRDNALGHNLLAVLRLAFPELAGGLDAQQRGHGAIAVRIRGWNGEDDDPRVEVTVAQTVAGTPALPDGGMPEVSEDDLRAGMFPPWPNWDGNDWFWLRASSFVDQDPEQPRVHADNAYVADRVLVADIPDRVPISFSGNDRSITVLLTDAHIAGRFSADLSSLEDPQLGGRWPVSDLLVQLPYAGVCLGTDAYRAVQRVTDLSADIRAVPGTGGEGVMCDAISAGISGIMTRSHLGGLSTSHDVLVNGCETTTMDGGMPDAGPPDGG